MEDLPLTEHGAPSVRHLLEVATNCTLPSSHEFPSEIFSLEDRKRGYIVVHILITMYMLAIVGILCSEFFVPAVEKIVKVTGIDTNVAGASLMAAAASFPQLATAIIGVFVAKNDVGLGSVVGSAYFNLLFAMGLASMVTSQTIQLHWWPVTRDCFAYALAAASLAVAVSDMTVHWYDGLVMTIVYTLYLLVLLFNQPIEHAVTACMNSIKLHFALCSCKKCRDKKTDEDIGLVGVATSFTEQVSLENVDKTGDETAANNINSDYSSISSARKDTGLMSTDEEYRSILSPPSHKVKLVCWVFLLPVLSVLFLLVPDFRRPGTWRFTYILTFVMSVILIGAAAYILVWMVTIIGDTAGVPDAIMGMTVLAAGSSLPDLINTILVARHGYGDMAVANCMGSNIFDILFCLGLPWVIDLAFVRAGTELQIEDNLTYVSVCLLLSALIVYIVLFINGWRLNRMIGVIFIVGYMAFTVISVVLDGVSTLPKC